MRISLPFRSSGRSAPGSSAVARAGRSPRVGRGDYLSSGRELYCVEHLYGERAVIEDCRSGDLFDVGVDELGRLEPVMPRAADPVLAQR